MYIYIYIYIVVFQRKLLLDFAFNTNHTQNTRKKYFFLWSIQFEPGNISDRLQCQYKYFVLALLLLIF